MTNPTTDPTPNAAPGEPGATQPTGAAPIPAEFYRRHVGVTPGPLVDRGSDLQHSSRWTPIARLTRPGPAPIDCKHAPLGAILALVPIFRSVAPSDHAAGLMGGKGGNVMRRDWLLAALIVAGGEPLTPVQLQKVMFLLGKRAPDGVGTGFYKFHPYNYGPFSAEIYRDAEAMAAEGLVRVERQQPGRPWATYAATSTALARSAALRATLGDERWSYLERLVQWARSLTFQQLVRAVYAAYPDQQVNSIFNA